MDTEYVKRSYQIVLDANNTASFSGLQFDARFNVDMNQIVRDANRLKKPHALTFEFLSRSSLFSVSGVTSTVIYKLHIDLGKGTPTIFQYNPVRAPSGLVRVSNEGVGVFVNPAAAGSYDIPVYFNAKPTDNEPIYIADLTNINWINLNLYGSGVGTFNAADDATINTNTKYVCIITLKEL